MFSKLTSKRIASMLGVLLLASITLTACGFGGSSGPSKPSVKDQASGASATRASDFQVAQNEYPAPDLQNFPLRQALIKMSEREDMTNHNWYIYLVSDYGTVYGYYVSSTVPINKCDFLSSTQDVVYDQYGNIVLTAPSNDGIFYGGGGASGGCDQMVFFDATTDQEMSYDVKAMVTDQPIKLYENDPAVVYLGGGDAPPVPSSTASASPTATVTVSSTPTP